MDDIISDVAICFLCSCLFHENFLQISYYHKYGFFTKQKHLKIRRRLQKAVHSIKASLKGAKEAHEIQFSSMIAQTFSQYRGSSPFVLHFGTRRTYHETHNMCTLIPRIGSLFLKKRRKEPILFLSL